MPLAKNQPFLSPLGTLLPLSQTYMQMRRKSNVLLAPGSCAHKKRSKVRELNFLFRACPSLGNFTYIHIYKKVESNCITALKYECHREVKKENDCSVLRYCLGSFQKISQGQKPKLNSQFLRGTHSLLNTEWSRSCSSSTLQASAWFHNISIEFRHMLCFRK